MVCPPQNETHQIWRSIIIVLLSYFRSFAAWLNMDLKKWSLWTQLIQKCTRRLPDVTQASRWSHGFQPSVARSGTPLYSLKKVTKDKLNQISQERTCRYLSLHRTEWMASAIQDQLLVPQAKQKAAAPSIWFEGRSPQSPHDCEQVFKPPEYVPSGDYSDFIDVNGNAD